MPDEWKEDKMEWFKFYRVEAEEFGVPAAMILEDLRGWLRVNKSQRKNIHNGYVWSFRSLDQLCEKFTFYSKGQIRRALKILTDCGRVLTADLSENRWRRVKYYSTPEFATTDKQECFDSFCEPEYTSGATGDTTLCYERHNVVLETTQRCVTDDTTTSATGDTTSKNTYLTNLKEITYTTNEANASDTFLSNSKIPLKYQDDVIRVLENWSEVMSIRFNSETNSKINKERASLISDRLKEGYTLEDCLEAIKRCYQNDFNMGRDGKNKTLYNDIKYIFTPERMERHLNNKTASERHDEAAHRSIFSELGGKLREQEEIDVTPLASVFGGMIKN